MHPLACGGRCVAAASLLGIWLCAAPSATALTNPINNGSVTVKLVSVATIPLGSPTSEPLDLAQPIGDSANGARLFVATHGGRLEIGRGSLGGCRVRLLLPAAATLPPGPVPHARRAL